ncbi:MAG: hypothetical protein Q8R76_07925 [Candidatus Omnitrophota bacterium]|nr:hypothetical protein [Candidatus Omnitrophota bacterium]
MKIPDYEMSFYEGLLREHPDYIDALIPLAELYTSKGLYEKGLDVDLRLSQLRKKDPVIHYNLACSLCLVGRKKEALTVLKRAIRLGYSDFDHLRRDSDLKILQGDPEFEKLIP